MVRDPMATYKSSNSQMCVCVSCFNTWQVAVRGLELHARSISIAIDYCDITYIQYDITQSECRDDGLMTRCDHDNNKYDITNTTHTVGLSQYLLGSGGRGHVRRCEASCLLSLLLLHTSLLTYDL